MSLVGPRPEDPEFVKLYATEYAEILSIRPGITSPASIIYYDEERLLSFSKATDSYVNAILPRKLRLDLLYVRHHSFLLDMDVFFRTLLYYLPQMRAIVPRMDEILFGPVQRLFRRHIPWFMIDWIIGVIAIGAAGVIWRLRTPLDVGLIHSLLAALFFASVFSLANLITGVHRTAWNRASGYEAVEITFSAALATLLLIPADKYLFRTSIVSFRHDPPRVYVRTYWIHRCPLPTQNPAGPRKSMGPGKRKRITSRKGPDCRGR